MGLFDGLSYGILYPNNVYESFLFCFASEDDSAIEI